MAANNATLLLVVLALAAAALGFAFRLVRRYLHFSGQRVVTCPETGDPTGVSVNAARAALALDTRLDINTCSRWPERQNCGQTCLLEIHAAPDGCLVRKRISAWYSERNCALCSTPLNGSDWIQRQPGVLTPDGTTTRLWEEIPAGELPQVLATHRPVCWKCQASETLRRERPDLVIDRDFEILAADNPHPDVPRPKWLH